MNINYYSKIQSVENLRWVRLFWGIPQPQQACYGMSWSLLSNQTPLWTVFVLELPIEFAKTQHHIKILAYLAPSPFSCHRCWVCTMNWDFSYPILCFLFLCVSWALPPIFLLHSSVCLCIYFPEKSSGQCIIRKQIMTLMMSGIFF